MNQNRFKFRAWDTHCNRMRYEEDYAIVPDTGLPHWIHDQELIQGEASQLILMQCTDLKDIEGNLIYEGDILQGFTKNDSIEFKEEVRFSPVLGYYISNKDIDDDRILYDNYVRFSDCKIIGNIYETV